ncbi:hypothetical protein D3C81_2011500 [compost metagenome]
MGVVVDSPGYGGNADQLFQPLQIGLVKGQFGFSLGDLGQRLVVAGLEVKDLIARVFQLRLGTGHGDFKGLGLETEQHLAFAHGLVVTDFNGRDDPGDIG